MAKYNMPCFLPWHSHAIHGKPCRDMYYTIYIMSPSWHTNGRVVYIMYKSWLSSSDHGNIMAHCTVPFIPWKPTHLSLYNGTHMYSMAKYNMSCFLPWHSHAIDGKPCCYMYYTIFIMSPSWHTNGRAMYIMYKSWLSASDHGKIMAHCSVQFIPRKRTNL